MAKFSHTVHSWFGCQSLINRPHVQNKKVKIAEHTYVEEREIGYGDSTKIVYRVKYYNTVVVEYWPDKVYLYTGGFNTRTTKERINENLPEGICVAANKGKWFVHFPDGSVSPWEKEYSFRIVCNRAGELKFE
jgi:hypothetical protein